ncbi:hypothetical protein [Streptomyces candidus]|uniref:Secreted protein n=1 Tax=Streptomyces candidus TaxID=67283 RepID=A0A7X0HA63_9ACTN|nr:hypothetical protein [Streptomyces candidus]MBB6433911.1 hypothetical protein [Streptomyces candidus]GHH34065.1 hypothetical protein GCM10018773_05630 [Streptomyces candidus]
MNSKNKKVLAASMLTLAATGMAVTPASADESVTGDYSQSVEIIRDICPTIQDIDVLTIEVLDEARAFQCNEIRQNSKVKDDSSAPALPILGAVHN